MDGTNPKVSFIPKGSLVREESFLERKRPRSIIGFTATFLFILVVGSYAGLFYYNDLLNTTIAERTTEIKDTQKEFTKAPEVEEAKVFRSRVDLAREILNAHTVTSPIFVFLSENTVSSIVYNRFSFKNDPALGATLELSGEAPTYAALAHQADILRKKKDELAGFVVRDVRLTNFGTISFTLALTFNSQYLLYTKNLRDQETAAPAEEGTVVVPASSGSSSADIPSVVSEPVSADAVAPVATTTFAAGVSFEATTTDSAGSLDGWTIPSSESTSTSVSLSENEPFWKTLWSKFKFW